MAAIQPAHGAGSGCSDLPVHPLDPEARVSMKAVGPDRHQTQVSVAIAKMSPVYQRFVFTFSYQLLRLTSISLPTGKHDTLSIRNW